MTNIAKDKEEMENIENKNIFLVETILKETNISINIPQYIYGIEESKSFFISLIGGKSFLKRLLYSCLQNLQGLKRLNEKRKG